MKMLPVKFSDTQVLKIKSVVDVVGIDTSKVARAAMRLGMEKILSSVSADPEKARELILVNDAMSK